MIVASKTTIAETNINSDNKIDILLFLFYKYEFIGPTHTPSSDKFSHLYE